MVKGAKYLSINGRPTKHGIRETIANESRKRDEFLEAIKVLDELSMKAIDRDPMNAILKSYANGHQAHIDEYKGMLNKHGA